MERLNQTPLKFYSDLGVDINNCTVLKLTIEHPIHGMMEETVPLDPFRFLAQHLPRGTSCDVSRSCIRNVA